MIPCFSFSLNSEIRPHLVTIGKFDGEHYHLAAASPSGQITIHNPHATEDGATIRTLSLNPHITSIRAGHFPSSENSSDHLYLTTPNQLLVYDVLRQADLVHLSLDSDVSPPHPNSLLVPSTESPSQALFVGGNCSLVGYDRDMSECYWNTPGGTVTSLLLMRSGGGSGGSSSTSPDGGDGILFVAADDYVVYLYRISDETLVCELNETNCVVEMKQVDSAGVVMVLQDGTVCMYRVDAGGGGGAGDAGWKRAWRRRDKDRATCCTGMDLTHDGVAEVIVGYESGVVEVLSGFTGKRMFRDQFGDASAVSSTSNSSSSGGSSASSSSGASARSVVALLVADYKGAHQKQLIACCRDGTVRGYLPEEIHEYVSKTTSGGLEQLEELRRRSRQLDSEIEGLQANLEGAAKGNGDKTLIPHETLVRTRLRPNPEKRSVDIVFETDPKTVIQLATVSGENLFEPPTDTSRMFFMEHPKNAISVGLRPVKDLTVQMHCRVLVGQPHSKSFHVYELEYTMPRFGMYFPRSVHDVDPTGAVEFVVEERLNRVCQWLNTSFNVVFRPDRVDQMVVRFGSLRDGTPLTVEYVSGKMAFRTDSIGLAGDLVQDLCVFLNVSELSSVGHFPKDFARVRQLLTKIKDLNSARLHLTTEMADVAQSVKGLVIQAENARVLHDMDDMLKHYRDLHDMNLGLMDEFTRRSRNHEALLESLKEVNLMMQKASRLRVGPAKTRIVARCREAFRADNPAALVQAMEFGISEDAA